METYEFVNTPSSFSNKGLSGYCNERAADGWRLKFITQTESGAIETLVFAKEVDAPGPS